MQRTKAGHRPGLGLVAGLMAVVFGAAPVMAGTGEPSPWQVGMQGMVTKVGQDLSDFHTLLVWIITIISVFVLALLLIIVFRFNERANPTPSKTTHHTMLEVAWTILP